jgi:hypothetical protein
MQERDEVRDQRAADGDCEESGGWLTKENVMAKYLLVWWIIHPYHIQNVHVEHGEGTLEQCEIRGAHIPVVNGVVRWHCTRE